MGGSKTTSTTAQQGTTTTTIPKEIRERGTKITEAAMGEYFDPASKYETYDYNAYKPVGEATTGQLNNYHDQAGSQYTAAGNNYQPYLGQSQSSAGNAAGNGVQGPNYNTANLQRFMNPYQDEVIGRGMTKIGEGLNTQRLQDQSRAALAGAFGGARHGVIDAESQRTAADTMQNYVGDELYRGFGAATQQFNTDFGQQAAAAGQNYSQNMGLANYYSGLGKQVQDQSLAAGDASLKLGNVVTAQDEAQKQNAYNYGYQDQRNYPMEVYERLAAMNAMQPINRTSSTTGTSTGTSGSSGGWLGPALQAGGSLLAMSDERSKEDVHERDPEEVLGAFAQVTPVTYAYKESAKRAHPTLTAEGERRGFMAQDYERAFGRTSGPTLKDGFKTVDLGNVLGDLVAAVHGLEKRTRPLRTKPKPKVN